MDEREQARMIAERWLDFKMNALVQMVPGDPDCDACVLARQFVRVTEALAYVNGCLDRSVELQSHYARILNDCDGGRRMSFRNGDEWMTRLRFLERQNQKRPGDHTPVTSFTEAVNDPSNKA